MADEPDYELRKDIDEASEPVLPARSPTLWPLAALLVVAAFAAAYLLFGSRRPAPSTIAESPPTVGSTEVPVPPLGGDADAIDVPPLDQSDGLVRELVRQLSSHPS